MDMVKTAVTLEDSTCEGEQTNGAIAGGRSEIKRIRCGAHKRSGTLTLSFPEGRVTRSDWLGDPPVSHSMGLSS